MARSVDTCTSTAASGLIASGTVAASNATSWSISVHVTAARIEVGQRGLGTLACGRLSPQFV